MLSAYEEKSACSQVMLGNNNRVQIVSGETNSHLKNSIDKLSSELQNPFLHIRNWVKGEQFDLGALIMAITEKESCDNRKQRAINKLKKDRETNQKLASGQFTFKGLFKSHDQKMKAQADLLESIAQTERDVANWDVVKRFLIVYLAEIAIPEFKQSKVIKYIGAM